MNPVTVRSPDHMVASADHLATSAGLAVLAAGGNAIDAAIATNAAIAVTAPHMCGLGGDLFALVHHDSTTYCLNASGRAGSGAICGTCHVQVDPAWYPRFDEPEGTEAALLEMVPERCETSRLACQLVLSAAHDGLSVRVPSRQLGND